MKNLDIRKEMSDRRLFNYEVAEAMGITEFSFSRKMRKELSPKEKEKVLAAIEEAAKAGR